jgi:hypothetical protein
MRSAAGAGYDDTKSAIGGIACEFCGSIGRPMS